MNGVTCMDLARLETRRRRMKALNSQSLPSAANARLQPPPRSEATREPQATLAAVGGKAWCGVMFTLPTSHRPIEMPVLPRDLTLQLVLGPGACAKPRNRERR
jgi:hypothetical protein